MKLVIRLRFLILLITPVAILNIANSTKTSPATQLSFPPYQIRLQTETAKPVALNEHMTLIIELEKLDPNAKDVESLNFDARMPEHKHGMVTKAKVTKLAPLKFKVEGVRLHMPGKWVFDFEILYAGGETKISSSHVLN
jgi:hypothetical protein